MLLLDPAETAGTKPQCFKTANVNTLRNSTRKLRCHSWILHRLKQTLRCNRPTQQINIKLSDSHQRGPVLTWTPRPSLHHHYILCREICKVTECRSSLAAHFHWALTPLRKIKSFKPLRPDTNVKVPQWRWEIIASRCQHCHICSVIIFSTLETSRPISWNLFFPL